MDLYIGVDPSINSSGISILVYKDGVSICNKFFIIKPQLTKKEQAYSNSLLEYKVYDKLDIKEDADYHTKEFYKIYNIRNIVKTIFDTINEFINSLGDVDNIYIYACQEGISYGSSLRTKSVADLAGLNFMLRSAFIDKNIDFIIASPSEIKKFATGKGNADKNMMLAIFDAIFDELKDIRKRDDIADAYFMAVYAKDNNK